MAPPPPALPAPGFSKENHAGAHQEENACRTKVGDEASEEGHCVRRDGKRPAPKFTRRVLLGDKVVGVIQGHQNQDQATQRV